MVMNMKTLFKTRKTTMKGTAAHNGNNPLMHTTKAATEPQATT